MKPVLRLVLSAMLLFNCCYAQTFVADDLELTWNIVESNYKNSNETLSQLTIENKGKVQFPAKGWTIYFNGSNPRLQNKEEAPIIIEQINGDYFKLLLKPDYGGIAPGEKLQVLVLSRALKNYTDHAKGFYIVFDHQTSLGIPIKYKTGSLVDHTPKEKELANKIYQENSLINNIPLAELPPVFPTPSYYKYAEGSFTLTAAVKIVAAAQFKKEADYLAQELKNVFGKAPIIAASGASGIILQLDKNIKSEGYEIKITPKNVFIKAANNAGVFYAIQSLKTMFPPKTWASKQSAIKLKAVAIKDAPRFAHRAFMMDVSRNFQPKAQVIKLIDLLALYKINVLHMHFNDDEGWRIEIPGLPELTEVGARRGHTLNEEDRIFPAYGSGPDVNNAAGTGFFSRKDYIEILKYATARHVQVIPEFETPGHARAAIKAMNARYAKFISKGDSIQAKKYLLRDLNDQSKYRSVQGWDDNVINPALPSVYTFLEKITDEIISMYKEAGAPIKTIHFGGDEVPEGVWEKSPAVKQLMAQDKTIENVDEMWHYYFKKVSQILKSRNLYLSGWEEIGMKKTLVNGKKQMVLDERFINENFHTDVWNNLHGNEDLAYKMANAGYKVVLTNVTNMYLDLAYNGCYNEPGQYWGGYVDVNKPYSFIPHNYYKNQKEDFLGQPLKAGYFDGKERLTAEGRKNIVGIQAPLWSEIITTKGQFEYLLLPKLFGLAERAWAVDPQWATETDAAKSELLYQKDWSVFLNTLSKKELPRLDHYAGGFSYRIPTVGVVVENSTVKANVQLPSFTIRYTTDGTEPTTNSPIYNNQGVNTSNLKLRVFNQNGRGGQTVAYQKQEKN